MNKEVDRPGKGGKHKETILVHIGFVGIKCCGKPVCFYCGVKLSNEYKVSDPDRLPDMPCCVGCGEVD